MIEPGTRDALVTFERAAKTIDAHGGEAKTWTFYGKAWARVRYGTGQERREAAQERATLSATFGVPFSRKLFELTSEDRINYSGYAWDISSVVPIGLNEDIEITAVTAFDSTAAVPTARYLTGTIGGGSALTGPLTIGVQLAGQVGATATLSGELRAEVRLSGTVAASAQLTGTLGGDVSLGGTVVSGATFTGTLTVSLRLSGTVAGAAILTGTIQAAAPLAGEIAAAATLTGTLTAGAPGAGFMLREDGGRMLREDDTIMLREAA